MRLSIIIPAHNEAATIAGLLQKVMEANCAPWQKQVIVVNDGSSDTTGQILTDFGLPRRPAGGRENLLMLHHDKNLGKGAAIRTGLKKAAGDYVIIQDADAEYDPGDIPKLLSSIAGQGDGVAVFGKRGYKAYPERGFHYLVGAWLLTNFFNLLYCQKLTDLYTGYKLIPAGVLKSLDIQANGFEFEAEVACKLAKRGAIIKEVPIRYQPRNKDQGKHIRFWDAVKGLVKILKLRFRS